MNPRVWKLAAVLATGAAFIVLLAACGHADFTAAATPDMAKAAAAAGATVTASGEGANRYPGGTGATWYQVARSAEADGEAGGVLVGVLTFDSAAARNGAYRQIQFRSNRLPATVVYTWGNAVVQMTRFDDWGLLQDLATAMEDAGAR
ncbi:MAG: hypothetical protein WCP98_04725 [Actinomycetes bacterium]